MLTALKVGQPIRGYAMQTHLVKSGTPTMGGVLILLSIAVSTLLWFELSNRFVWIDADRHPGFWRDWLGGRLAQGGQQRPRRHALAREVFLAVGDWPGGGRWPWCSAFPRSSNARAV